MSWLIVNHPPRRDEALVANKGEAEGKLQAVENNPGIKRLVKALGRFQINQKILAQYHRKRSCTVHSGMNLGECGWNCILICNASTATNVHENLVNCFFSVSDNASETCCNLNLLGKFSLLHLANLNGKGKKCWLYRSIVKLQLKGYALEENVLLPE